MNSKIEDIERQMSEICLERMLLRIDSRLQGTPFPSEDDDALAKREWALWAEREKLVSDDIRLLFSDDTTTINDRGVEFPLFLTK